MKDNHAPVFVDTFRLCNWLLGRLEKHPAPLPRALCSNALRLLEYVALAIKHRDLDTRLEQADERLIVLRLQIRLAEERSYLSQDQTLFALDCADQIGRQIGGWMRKLETA